MNVRPRHAATTVAAALNDTRVVVLNGARQCGKSTLVEHVAQQQGGVVRSLDNEIIRGAATADPTGFIQGEGLSFQDGSSVMVIDEIQRAPQLLLPIKEQVDRHRRPGQFLLTGSARVLGLRDLPDALPGRTETIELWPFSQGEIDGAPDGFVDTVFAGGAAVTHESDVSRTDYVERVVRGGFPEAVARVDSGRRQRFHDSYVSDLIARDVSQLSDIQQHHQLHDLVRLLASRSGHLLVESRLATETGLSRPTVNRYLQLLEEVFLIKRIPAWSRNLTTRVVGTPKLAMVDSGIAANLMDADAMWLARVEAPLGPLLEGFVLMELARQLSWSRQRATLSHYRTRDGVEVDAVLENRRGQVVACEVKAAHTVKAEDFRGLKHLQTRLGDDFLLGAVLYTGAHTLSFGEALRAIPISALWQLG